MSVAATLGLSLAIMAVPAKQGTRTFVQPDGTTISLALIGDERFHTFVTTDGLPVERTADGDFRYLTAQGISDVTAHNPGARTKAEAAFLAENSGELSVQKLARRHAAKRAKAPAAKASQVPNIGSARVPIILVAYKDYPFRDGANALSTFKEFFNEGNKSARQYFVDQSNGKYTPQFDVYGPITLSGSRATYGGNDYSGNDKGVGKMVGEACQGLNSTINFKDYDNDGDGECDVVIVLYAGDGEASSYDDDAANAVWPCQWDLRSSDFGKALTLDGVTVNKFAVFNELNGSDLTQIDGVGTFCHEFSHCLGLPDFYDTEYSGHFGMGPWSLMDQGSYNDDGYTPPGYSAYEKEFMGWINIPEATENTRYNLPVFNQKNAATDHAVKITNSRDKDEYYILENRAQQGWDTYMPAEGLMITHVTYDASAWNSNVVNNYSLQRMTIIPADNNLKMDKISYYGETYYQVNEQSLLGDLWPYGGADELTDESTPAAKVNTGGYMGKPVTEIKRNADGNVSFLFMKAALPSVSAPSLASPDGLASDGFTATWSHTPETEVTYTLETWLHRDITYTQVFDADLTSEAAGWDTEGYCSWENDGLRMGSSNSNGSVISPQFTADESGLITVAITSKAWSSTEGSAARISVLDAAGTVIDETQIPLTGQFADYHAVLDSKAGGATRVRIETIAKKKRMFVSHVTIFTGDATEALQPQTKAPSETGDESRRTITGITGLSYDVTGLTPGAVYDYRVKAVPVNDAEWNESQWSETRTADLSQSGIATPAANVRTGDVEYYNMQGLRVDKPHLAPGIYIRRQGSASDKVVIR